MEATSEPGVKQVLQLIVKKKWLFLAIAAAVTTAIVIAAYLLPKTYAAQSVIFIERNVLNQLIKDVTVTSSLDEKVRALSIVMKSRNIIMKVLGDLDPNLAKKSPGQLEGLVRSYQNRTEITIELNKATHRDMDLFMVSFTDSDPVLASNFVNGLVRRYIEDNVSIKREQAFGASRFLLDQLSTFKVKLEKIESAIARQRKNRNIPEKDGAVYDQLQALIAKRDNLLVQYTESHPDVVRVKAEIEVLRAQISDTPAAAVSSDRELVDLERERETTKKIYEDLLGALRKSEVSTELEVQDKAGAFRIIDPAVAQTRPISPNMLHMILLAVVGGFAAAGGLMIVLDRFDRSVKSVDTLKKMGMPVLAVISTMQTPQQIAAKRKKNGMFYAVAGAYLAVLVAMAAIEALGLPIIDTFVKEKRVEVSGAMKK